MADNVLTLPQRTDAQLAPCTCGGLGWALDGTPGPDGRPTMRRCIGCASRSIVRQFGGDAQTWANWTPRPELDKAVPRLRSWPDGWRGDHQWACLLHCPNGRREGNFGAGKSHACQATAHEFAGMGLAVRYVVWDEYLEELRDAFGDDRPHPVPLAEFDGLLILDDLGKEKETPWTQEKVGGVTDWRYRHRLPTLIATNLDAKRLEERYPRLYSRCHEGVVIPWWAPDWRRR